MATTKTLLLCFIHGFRGGDFTFDDFPKHLTKLINEEKPDIKIETTVYPKYETKGDLPACVANFRQWLLEKVLTMEKAAGNTSPKTNPSVGVVLVGHSMGGFLAADCLLSILDDIPSTVKSPNNPKPPAQMFPLVHGILTFDTPFCGLSRSMFAYGALSSYQGYSSASSLFSLLAMRMGPGAALYTLGSFAYKNRDPLQRGFTTIQNMKWEDWVRMKDEATGRGPDGKSVYSYENMQEGLKYLSKDNVGEGMAFLSGHLEFVSALFRGVELQERLERLGGLRGVGFADLYTTLGENSFYSGGYFIPERTFIALPAPPTSDLHRFFIKEPTTHPTTSADEIKAHLNMFSPTLNTAYEDMSSHSKGLVTSWVRNNSGRVTDAWRNEKAEQAEQWKDLTRYTIDEADGSLKPFDENKDRQAREKYWFTPDMSALGSYVPSVPSVSVPSMPSVGWPSRPSSKDGTAAPEAATAEKGVEKDAEAGEASTDEKKEEKTPQQPKASYTSYLWNSSSGATEAPAAADTAAAKPGATRSWLDYGYSYLPSRSATPSQPAKGDSEAAEAGGNAAAGLAELDRMMGMNVPGVTEDLKF